VINLRTAKKYREYKSSKDLPALCRVKDVASYLGINVNKGYEIFRREDFNSFKIGNKFLVQKEELINWIEKQAKKQTIIN
jgi:hypothetical protein